MVNTICLHEGCQRKPVKDGNGYCHLHGGRVHSKCSYPQCSNFAQTPGGVCIKHGYKKKCSKNGCTNNDIRKGFCKNHAAIALRSTVERRCFRPESAGITSDSRWRHLQLICAMSVFSPLSWTSLI